MQRRIGLPLAPIDYPEKNSPGDSGITSEIPFLKNDKDTELGLLIKKDNSAFNSKHSSRLSGYYFFFLILIISVLFFSFFNYSNPVTRISAQKNPIRVSQIRVLDHMKNMNKFGERTTGSYTVESFISIYVHEFIQSLQSLCRKNNWILSEDDYYNSDSYNLDEETTQLFIAYQNITNIIISLNPLQNEGLIDDTMLPSILINVPLDMSLLSNSAFIDSLSPSCILDSIYSLVNRNSNNYNQRIIINFCLGSQQIDQCINSFSNHKWASSISRIINIETDKYADYGISLYSQTTPLFELGNYFKSIQSPNGNSFTKLWASIFDYESKTSFTKYQYNDLMKETPSMNIRIGLKPIHLYMNNDYIDKQGYIQSVANSIFSIILLSAKQQIQDCLPETKNQYLFFTLFSRNFYSFSYFSITIFSSILTILALCLYPTIHMHNILFTLLNYIPCICLYLLTICVLTCVITLLGLSSFWYSHHFFAFTLYGSIGVVIYIYIYIKEYQIKLKQYTIVSPEEYLYLQYLCSSLISVLLSLIHSPFVLLSLTLSISSFLLVFIPYIIRFMRALCSNKKSMNSGVSSIDIQSNLFYLLIALCVNILPILIITTSIMRDTFSLLIPLTKTLGNINALETEFMVSILISIFILCVLFSVHPFLSLFSNYSTTLLCLLMCSCCSIILFLFLPIFTSSNPRPLILVHSTKMTTENIRERNHYRGVVRSNYLDIYVTDFNSLTPITNQIKLPTAHRSSLKDAFSMFTNENYKGSHDFLETSLTIPLFTKKYPFLYIKRDEVCEKKCVLKTTKLEWRRHIRFSYEMNLSGGVYYIEMLSDKIISWSFNMPFPLPVDEVQNGNSNKNIYKYHMIFYSGISPKPLKGDLYFDDNNDITINIHAYYSESVFKQYNITHTPTIKFIKNSFSSHYDTTVIDCLESHFIIEKFYSETNSPIFTPFF